MISLSVSEPQQLSAPLALPVVRVENVSVTYRTSIESKPTLKQSIMRAGRGERSVREIKALRDVSFDVPAGTVLGIIGSNGAGKSTLMRTIAGILPPTEGRIEVRGRVSTLLSLGVGFNPSLSGQENVVLGGLAAGYSKAEIQERYEAIADFADIRDFMDVPMRAYSSGMYARLAFSVAVHLDPDILIVDEALSTGDAAFKAKAMAKMKDLVGQARAMFVVSHALGTIKDLCNDAIWLNKGTLMGHGTPDDVARQYTEFLHVGDTATTNEDF